jgi:cytochrome c oxidase subunit 2
MIPVTVFSQDHDISELISGENLWKYCTFCHSADALGHERSDAPKLAGDQAWYTARQLKYFRNKIRGYHPEDIPGLQMAVYSVPAVTDEAIQNLANYIEALPVTPANPVPDRMARRPKERPYPWDSELAQLDTHRDADPVMGEELYQSCAACHGDDAQGIEALNAPRLDNKQDWYLTRQMKYYKLGARGTHEDDVYGKQMVELGTLENDQEIVDVVSYIMTLSKGPFY